MKNVFLLLSLLSFPLVALGQNNYQFGAVTNAANYVPEVAQDSLASIFLVFTTDTGDAVSATQLPLPTRLGGVEVLVQGKLCQLLFVHPHQINFLVPPDVSLGNQDIVIRHTSGASVSGKVLIQSGKPGIFAFPVANRLFPQGVCFRRDYSTVGGAYTDSNDSLFGYRDGQVIPRECLGSEGSKRLGGLILFGTGVRTTSAPFTATVEGVPVDVWYAGVQPQFVGLDQINLHLPEFLNGIGWAEVVVRAGSYEVVRMKILLGGTAPKVNSSTIAVGQTVNGDLRSTDQIQPALDQSGAAYYYDAFRLTLGSPANVSFSMSSSVFPPQLFLYRLQANRTLEYLAAGIPVASSAAELTARVPAAGEYVLIASSRDEAPNVQGGYTVRFNSSSSFTDDTGESQPIVSGGEELVSHEMQSELSFPHIAKRVSSLPPVILIGSKQTTRVSLSRGRGRTASVQMHASVVNPVPLPGERLALKWSSLTVGRRVRFSSPTKAKTRVTFFRRGKYLLELEAFDGFSVMRKTVKIMVSR